MVKFADDRYYLESHEWAKLEEDGTVVVGISDHAQEALGDVVFVELPEVGDELVAKSEAGVVESVKAASDIYTPISGVVSAINEQLEESPEIVNDFPYDEGWFFKIRPSDSTELSSLLSVEKYREICEE
ncbi:MAG: glycine cleavage system protein GcvH [Candidatus Azotimanducaceae bacterium]|uniref:Glycine cleavage system H protein n=1 Tax=OM182 bacterium TaxID=2510334 RepID=A0A520S5C2_9GAMM|nr:glycine cleavage system protein H [Gammaproteobacteria bacterium]OUV68659.1 MAG: glycine cleavage system protein H [Gammaproteobacteria bacterium TMED133]RZO77660.1 MAG: glycine cleavage system protein GcvH [OM182 bacterium]